MLEYYRRKYFPLLQLIVVILAINLAYASQTNEDENDETSSKPVILDYYLYAQLLDELTLSSDENDQVSNRDLVNYYRLNRYSLSKYNKYLYFDAAERTRLKRLSKEMFEFGFDNYMQHAYPYDELDPIHCTGRGPDYLNPHNININDALGGYMLTLVESLTTLAIMGNSTEFKRAVELVIKHLSFDKNNTVQVFEATIRMLGGLLSSHMIIVDDRQPYGNMSLDNYHDELLHLAEDLARRLLVAFDDKDNRRVNLPYPRVNLRTGIPADTFTHTCTSGAGTLLLEFGMLSRLLNEPSYEKAARKAVDSIYSLRNSETGLVGNEIDVQTGQWLGQMSGLGAGIDSFYEYLLKGFILFSDSKDYDMYESFDKSIKSYLRRGRSQCLSGIGHHPIYINVNMNDGKISNNWIDSMQASFPAIQVLNGDLEEAICFHALYYAIWKKFDVIPERYNWNMKMPDVFFYPLRPEFAESTYFLYQATKNPFYLHVAKSILESIESFTKVRCGYATVHDVTDKSLEDRMESFFLSETLKYLYLTFDETNYLNKQGSMENVFTTEGHMFPIRAHKLASHQSTFDEDNLNATNSHFKLRKKFKLVLDNSSTRLSENAASRKAKSTRKQKNCSLGRKHATTNVQLDDSSLSFDSLKTRLPMQIKYFDQLFDMVGVDLIKHVSGGYLERKAS